MSEVVGVRDEADVGVGVSIGAAGVGVGVVAQGVTCSLQEID